VAGYVKPTFGVLYRPQGVEQDQWDYSAAATIAGLEVHAEPLRGWVFTANVLASGEVSQNVGGGGSGGGGGGGEDDKLPFTKTDFASLSSAIDVLELSVGYRPTRALAFRAGQMRIPFTLSQQVGMTALVFATRDTFTDVFLRGADLGAMGTVDLGGKLVVQAGVFNGATVTTAGDNERGALYTARLDYNPLGDLPQGSADFNRGPLRVGFGGAVIYMPGTQYTPGGFELMRTRDIRASASARASWRGLSIQSEVLRRQRTTNISSRPLVSTGAYAQASYFWHFTRGFATAPIARLGWVREDEAFDPRDVSSAEVGLSLYLIGDGQRPDDVRFTIQYQRENRVTEGELAHGGFGQLQLRF